MRMLRLLLWFLNLLPWGLSRVLRAMATPRARSESWTIFFMYRSAARLRSTGEPLDGRAHWRARSRRALVGSAGN